MLVVQVVSSITCILNVSQVLIGFTGTGYITLILLIIQYVLGFAPDSDANPIDRSIIRWLWRKSARRPSYLWGRALEKVGWISNI